MQRLSKSEMTARLGRSPDEWTFLGQCYDAGEDNQLICMLTEQPGRFFFTLKPKSGDKGRATIVAESIDLFERWNPDLYIKLRTGLMWLQLRCKAVEADEFAAAMKQRVRLAERECNMARSRARQCIFEWRKSNKKAALPEYLAAMKELLQKPGLYFQTDEAKALWLEAKTVELDRALQDVPGNSPTGDEVEPVQTSSTSTVISETIPAPVSEQPLPIPQECKNALESRGPARARFVPILDLEM